MHWIFCSERGAKAQNGLGLGGFGGHGFGKRSADKYINWGVETIGWKVNADLFASYSNDNIEKKLAEYKRLSPPPFKAVDLSHLKF